MENVAVVVRNSSESSGFILLLDEARSNVTGLNVALLIGSISHAGTHFGPMRSPKHLVTRASGSPELVGFFPPFTPKHHLLASAIRDPKDPFTASSIQHRPAQPDASDLELTR
jgi:hypothetical protein